VWGVEDIAALVEKAKQDKQIRESIIAKYTPFILKTASDFTGRYINAGIDEEYSIGLIAFNEAIDSFDSKRGVSFFAFARIVIRRRLMDHVSRQNKNTLEVSIQTLEEQNPYIEYGISIDRYKQTYEQENRRLEIEDYSRALQEFDISFDSLVDAAPKKKDARSRAVEAARIVAESPQLLEYLTKHRQLPLAEILCKASVSRKTLERHRKYIIAIVLILSGDYYYLKDYIQG
jgi:RNA polymerase sigma factor